MSSKNVLCPSCGVPLELDETYDQYSPDEYTTVDQCIGICPKCHKTFQWEEVFIYHHYRKIEEVTGE